MELRDSYLEIMTDLPGLRPQPGGHEDWVAATINFEITGKSARDAVGSLAQKPGIQARRWWGATAAQPRRLSAAFRNANCR